jgi:hypothetical protein
VNPTITIQNRIWLPLVAAGTALALAVGLLTFVVLEQRTSEPADTPRQPVAAPVDVPQAEWKIAARAEGALRIPKALKTRAEDRGAEVGTAIQQIYDAFFLDPASVPKVLKETFTRQAAAALADPGIGLPAGAEDVQTISRKAAVVVYAGTGAQATARVVVVAEGTAEGKPFRVKHASTLWFERDDGDWRVIAFEVDQRP